jgi:hypothetical protein
MMFSSSAGKGDVEPFGAVAGDGASNAESSVASAASREASGEDAITAEQMQMGGQLERPHFQSLVERRAAKFCQKWHGGKNRTGFDRR